MNYINTIIEVTNEELKKLYATKEEAKIALIKMICAKYPMIGYYRPLDAFVVTDDRGSSQIFNFGCGRFPFKPYNVSVLIKALGDEEISNLFEDYAIKMRVWRKIRNFKSQLSRLWKIIE